jgi:hypothetical protein
LDDNSFDNKSIGRRLINTAVNLDESLEEILRMEVKRLKQSTKNDSDLEELRKTSHIIKNILIALMITDEKLRTGIELCSRMDETKQP